MSYVISTFSHGEVNGFDKMVEGRHRWAGDLIDHLTPYGDLHAK